MDQDRIQQAFFFTLLGALTLGFVVLLWSFFQPIFWATIIGVVFLPVQNRLERDLGHTLSAVLTLFIILVTVLVPTFLIAGAVADQGLQLYQRLETGTVSPGAMLMRVEEWMPAAWVDFLEQIGVSPATLQERMTRAAVDASGFIAGLAVSIGQNVGRFAVMFFIMMYLLFFALRDGEQLLDRLTWALPLGDERERYLFAKFAEVGRATIKGTLVVGGVQGTLGGIMFAILGIQGAVFWGVVMIFLSVLPAVGAGLVWLPASLMLILGGSWIRGVILLAFGVLVIGLIDNILRPLLVGRDTKMPDWLILLSTLGGLATFGISGFIIGPIIAALFLTVWTMFGEEQALADAEEDGAVGSEGDALASGSGRDRPAGDPVTDDPAADPTGGPAPAPAGP